MSAPISAAAYSMFEPQPMTCRECGLTFKAPSGFIRYCDPCTEIVLSREAEEKKRPQWDASFPKRAISDSARISGASLECAKSILPALQREGTVILCGDRGTGKTVLSTWIAGEMRTGIYTKAYDLFAAIKASWAKDSKLTEIQVLESWRRPRLLIIDEAQERGETVWEGRTLTNLVDHRYDDLGKATIIITNQSPEESAKTLGPSIIRRANQTGGVIVCNWPSYV